MTWKSVSVLILPMRDWNTPCVHHVQFGVKFWSYLWGIEIYHPKSISCPSILFWSYLWGIEIKVFHNSHGTDSGFDLTYEGLKLENSFSFVIANSVLILPMRDWNKFRSLNGNSRVFLFWSYLWGIEIKIHTEIHCLPNRVLILPMRDWNEKLQETLQKLQTEFWSYLWGIEMGERLHEPWAVPCFDLTYEGLKHHYTIHFIEIHFKFWSYLWGIKTEAEGAWLSDEKGCFDLTYEGLK